MTKIDRCQVETAKDFIKSAVDGGLLIVTDEPGDRAVNVAGLAANAEEWSHADCPPQAVQTALVELHYDLAFDPDEPERHGWTNLEYCANDKWFARLDVHGEAIH